VRMYRVVRAAIHDVFREIPVGLCKETVEVRKAVDVIHNRCNCAP